jgi:hypothetical protein
MLRQPLLLDVAGEPLPGAAGVGATSVGMAVFGALPRPDRLVCGGEGECSRGSQGGHWVGLRRDAAGVRLRVRDPPGLLHPRIVRPEQLSDRARGRRLLHAGHGLVTVNTALMIVVAMHLGGAVARHSAGWAALTGTTVASLAPGRLPQTRARSV